MKWLDNFFSDKYLPFDRFICHTYYDTLAQCSAVVDLLNVTAADPVLDVCCGWGRLTIPLIKQGYQITGIDQSAANITHAWRQAQEEEIDCKCKLIQGDVLQMKWSDEFSGAYCIGTSFGYYTEPYESDDLNLLFLQNVFNALQPGASFLLEQLYLPGLDIDYFYNEGKQFIRVPLFEPRTRIYSGLVFIQDMATGNCDINVWRLKLYNDKEITRMLQDIGFIEVKCYGDFYAKTLQEDSWSMIVLAKKP